MEINSCSLSDKPVCPSSPIITDQLIQFKKQASKMDQFKSDQSRVNHAHKIPQRGVIELIMGPMFAGKSTELLRRVNRLEISGKRVLNIKYAADTRYS